MVVCYSRRSCLDGLLNVLASTIDCGSCSVLPVYLRLLPPCTPAPACIFFVLSNARNSGSSRMVCQDSWIGSFFARHDLQTFMDQGRCPVKTF